MAVRLKAVSWIFSYFLCNFIQFIAIATGFSFSHFTYNRHGWQYKVVYIANLKRPSIRIIWRKLPDIVCRISGRIVRIFVYRICPYPILYYYLIWDCICSALWEMQLKTCQADEISWLSSAFSRPQRWWQWWWWWGGSSRCENSCTAYAGNEWLVADGFSSDIFEWIGFRVCFSYVPF